LEALAQALTRNDSLELLNIGWNRFGIAGLTSLANALRSNQGLARLYLDSTSIDDAGSIILADALATNTSLSVLHLGGNNITNDGASPWLDVLTKCNTTLTMVDLKHNGDISHTISSAIARFVSANGARTRLLNAGAKLDLSSRRIDRVQAKRAAMELAVNTTVTELLLNGNNLHHQGCVDIANALIQNRVLTSIELDDCLVGDDGCSAMAAMLGVNSVLTKISLNKNRIGPAGAIALADMMQINVTLEHLGLGQNNIDNEGAAAIAAALRWNAKLERLDLSSNRISDVGVMAILKALKEINCSLMWLNLEGNAEISSSLQKDIGFVLASRITLKSFCKFLGKPLDQKLMSMAIQGLQLNSIKNPEVAHVQEATAGPIFLLVRAAALGDSKVVKAALPSRKRGRLA
jgi:NLR family CARD domain-containing protein 3